MQLRKYFRVSLSCALFLLSGVVQTVCIQFVLNSGGGDQTTFLLALPNYIGLCTVYFIGSNCFKLLDEFGVWCSNGDAQSKVHAAVYSSVSAKRRPPFFKRFFQPDRLKLFLLAFNELSGFLTGLFGIAIAGSGLYQVVFSGGAVFTAILSTVFLQKAMSFRQWSSIACITVGLMTTAEQAFDSNTAAEATSSDKAFSLLSGLLFVLLSCLFYSTNYVLSEYLLGGKHQHDALNCEIGSSKSSQASKVTGIDLSLHVGGTCLLFFSAYVFIYTIPNWDALVVSSIERNKGNVRDIAVAYICLAIASFLHAISHYDIVASVGAVPIGVLNALRAVSVFAASSYFFCERQPYQCYTRRKGISTAVVLLGATTFSLSSPKSEFKKKNEVPSG